MSKLQSEHPIRDAAKAAFPYSAPMIAAFLFLGMSYGVYMKALGFNAWYPFLMASLIYAGSVEFIVAGSLVVAFANHPNGEWQADLLRYFYVGKIRCAPR